MGCFPKDEIKRKLFHALSLIYIAVYWFFPRPVIVWGMGAVLLIVVGGEWARWKSPAFDRWILRVLGGVHRAHEEGAVSGLPWTLSGSYLAMLLFPQKDVVMVGLLYMALGDAAAALFGRAFGKTKLIAGKSLEGSSACFIVCFFIGWYFLGVPLAIIGALVATIIELIPWPLNDNFWMPLISAALLGVLRTVIH
ncbi:MAG: hypothetical protein NTU66_04040 [Elusimicrobia bacterium]|nr:hypothetical protein [Elusimicrobiota bacterium]